MAKGKNTPKDTIESISARLKPAMLRFLYLYMGMEDGKCWNNATLSYIRAYEIDTPTTKVIKKKNGEMTYTPQYKSAATRGYELVRNSEIQRLRHLLLSEAGYTPENIKKRYAELAIQNKNPIVALNANDRMAKIANVIDDNKKVNIPELEALGDAIKSVLTPKKK